MAKSLNKWTGIGNLGADPESRFTPGGKAVTQFSVACSSSWKNADGETQENTEWVKCVAWDKLAEICNQYLNKGSKVYVEGRLQTRKWQDKEGNDRYTTEVVLSDMLMLDGKNSNGENAPTPATPARQAAPRQPARNVPQRVDDRSDLPF
jgi:single-strand DNA-binding protein